MENSFKISYVTTLPKEGNAPRVTITGTEIKKYKVEFYELTSNENYSLPGVLLSSGYCETNQTIFAKTKQWFTNWYILIKDENDNIVKSDFFNLKDKIAFIKMDAFALGDSIAWIPYVEEFRKKHKCKVICSTFHNHIFSDVYPDIMFVQPNTVIDNVYVQYYIGASNDGNMFYSPIKVNENPLQAVAAIMLGMDLRELKPDLSGKYKHIKPRLSEHYVTLSEYGSTPDKSWKEENGWQGVVDYLNEKGYKVLVISKEKTNLKDVIDLTGDISLEERAVDIMNAKFHLGVSSGLSWFAWALGTHVFMISDVTPNWHEFQTDITRVNANNLSSVNYLVESQSSLGEVIKKLDEMIG